MQDPVQFYAAKVSALGDRIGKLRVDLSRVSNFRAVVAVAWTAGIYGAVAVSGYWWLIILVLTTGFVLLVRKSGQLKHSLEIVEVMRALAQHELSFLKGDKSVFDAGSDQSTKDHLYALDLDIFGKGSLFQTVNRTATVHGRHKVIRNLLQPLNEPVTIAHRTEAIRDLASRPDFRHEFFALGSLSRETKFDADDVNLWTRQEDFFANRKHLLWIASIMTGISTAVILFGTVIFPTIPIYVFALFILVILNSIILSFFSRANKLYFYTFGARTALFEKLTEVFKLVSVQSFRAQACIDIKNEAGAASIAFGKLSKLSNAADQRLNGLMGPLMNGLFFFDVWSIYRIEGWRKEHHRFVAGWIDALAQLDMLNSFANFSFNHPGFCWPSIQPGPNHIVGIALAHPLIAGEIAITNDFSIGNTTKAHIITGSNMAGKSTFIRGVGLNVVLAMNGLPVCAASFACSVMRVISCIRITDSLEDDASYFKAELTRLHDVVTVLQSGAPCLVLLDEILRGTNSDDKRNGTMAFYNKFKSYNCVALLATHDLAVGALENDDPGYFENFCFESRVEEDDLKFDYKLRRGISTAANATFLMKRMGLI